MTTPGRTPRPPRVPRPQRDLRVRSDESIGRPEDIGSNLAAKPIPTAAAPAIGKTTRVTLDLDPARYAALRKWLAAADAEMSPVGPRVSLAAALRAMIDATTKDQSIGLVVIDLLRRGQP